MLAQNFMKSKALKITDKEHGALIAVLHALDRGELKHRNHAKPDGPNGFNMGRLRNEMACGTVACLKGWAQTFAGKEDVFDSFRMTSAVADLFMYQCIDRPETMKWNREKVTTDQAAHALRNYLTSGAARWGEVLV